MRPKHLKLTRQEAGQLQRAATACGLGQVAGLVAVAEPALALCLGKPRAKHPVLGQSRIGGLPDLPASEPWPEQDGEPYTFIAQLNLSEVDLSKRWKLPKSGMLYMFMGLPDSRFAVEHRVVYVPRPRGGLQLARRRPTEGAEMRYEEAPALKPCTFRTFPVISLPNCNSLAYERLGIPDEEEERVWNLTKEVSEPTRNYQRGARCFGYPHDVDDDPRYVVAIHDMGRRLFGDDWKRKALYDRDWKHKNRARIEKRASEWTLLFEMGSSHALGLCIWDYYTLHILIRWQDLAARRFDRTRALASRT